MGGDRWIRVWVLGRFWKVLEVEFVDGVDVGMYEREGFRMIKVFGLSN